MNLGLQLYYIYAPLPPRRDKVSQRWIHPVFTCPAQNAWLETSQADCTWWTLITAEPHPFVIHYTTSGDRCHIPREGATKSNQLSLSFPVSASGLISAMAPPQMRYDRGPRWSSRSTNLNPAQPGGRSANSWGYLVQQTRHRSGQSFVSAGHTRHPWRISVP